MTVLQLEDIFLRILRHIPGLQLQILNVPLKVPQSGLHRLQTMLVLFLLGQRNGLQTGDQTVS